jgi:hypothetical protein
LLIRIVDAGLGDIEPDDEIAARQRRIPLRRIQKAPSWENGWPFWKDLGFPASRLGYSLGL